MEALCHGSHLHPGAIAPATYCAASRSSIRTEYCTTSNTDNNQYSGQVRHRHETSPEPWLWPAIHDNHSYQQQKSTPYLIRLSANAVKESMYSILVPYREFLQSAANHSFFTASMHATRVVGLCPVLRPLIPYVYVAVGLRMFLVLSQVRSMHQWFAWY